LSRTRDPSVQSSLPKLAIVIPRVGIGSEVWTIRQAAAMTRLRPTFVTWSDAGEVDLPEDIPCVMVGGSFPHPTGMAQRVLRRLGLAAGYRLPSDHAARIADALSGFDAVLCHFAWTAIPVTQVIAGRQPLIWHVHGRDVSALLREGAYCAALRRYLPQADALIAVGEHQLTRLRTMGAQARARVIPCGAPIAELAKWPLATQDNAQVQIISVGRMSEEKGVMQTLEAFEILARERDDVSLMMIGDGPLLADVRARARASAAAASIHIPGLLSSSDIAQALSSAQIFTQHSREVNGWIEGFGVTMTEAGAFGLPLVVSDSGGLADQLENGVNGLSFAKDDAIAQAAALARLVGDSGLRKKMGVEARRLALRFDTALMVQNLETEILKLLNLKENCNVG